MNSETAKKNEIIYIQAEHIRPHPDNPRKELGDLSELEESIRKNGILQNLTVIPVEGEPGEYMALIGHRRHAAGIRAGIKEFPCQIAEGLDLKEQVAIMLEENMQRNDLTIWEQANGFQMMLDLGESVEQIAQKTGFSDTTIRHRLNIAKLNQKELKKKDQDESFQLSLRDLYELEKIKDLKTRNKILKYAQNSREITTMAQREAAEALRNERYKQFADMAEKAGIEKAPEGTQNELYSGKWDKIKEIDLDKEIPKRLDVKESEKLYYLLYWRNACIIKKHKNEKKKLTPEETAKKEKDKKKKQLKAIIKEMDASRKDFILNIIEGKIRKPENEEEIREKIWRFLIESCAYLSSNGVIEFFTSKEYYNCSEEEKEEAKEKLNSLSYTNSMLLALHNEVKDAELIDYRGCYREKEGKRLKRCYDILKPYGWIFAGEDEEKVLDGTHELCRKEEEQ